MNFTELRVLCEREWDNDRGDVIELRLKNESLAELSVDLLLTPKAWNSLSLSIPTEDLPIIAGGTATVAQNPITRSVIRLFPVDDSETALVNYGGHREHAVIPLS